MAKRSTRAVGTEIRREAFLLFLRLAGPGPSCITWPWVRPEEKGYPHISVNRKFTSPSRWVWERLNGSIPEGMNVCHACDNPPCCRPSHLWLGTQSENQKDAFTKGRNRLAQPFRRAYGEAHGRAKLRAGDIRQIRREAAIGPRGTQARLAREYGVTKTQIGYIVSRKFWADLPDEEPTTQAPAAQA